MNHEIYEINHRSSGLSSFNVSFESISEPSESDTLHPVL